MKWKHLGRYGTQDKIVGDANKSNVGAGGLVVCLANKNEYSAWINTDAKPGSGKWDHFAVDTDAGVVSELNRRAVTRGNATVAVNGDQSQYIVFYYA